MNHFTRTLRLTACAAALAFAASFTIPSAAALDVDDEWGSARSSSERYAESSSYAESGSGWGLAGQERYGGTANMAPTLPGAPTQVPIDGGLSLLALAGAGYAAHKLRRREDDDSTGDAVTD